MFTVRTLLLIPNLELLQNLKLSASCSQWIWRAQLYWVSWQGFGSGGASVRSCYKFPPCSIEPVMVTSKMDPLLAKSEPISDSGSSSVITYLRRKEKKKKPAQHQFTCVMLMENG